MHNDFIENHGLIGDCYGCALISQKADIVWLTLRRFDSDPFLWHLLDDEKGGFLKIDLASDFQWKRYYRPQTNILVTEAENSQSLIRITDFMPVGRIPESKTHDYTRLEALHGLVRKIEVYGKPIEILVSTSFNPWPGTTEKIHLYSGIDELKIETDETLTINLHIATAHYLVLTQEKFENISHSHLINLERVTENFWEEWIEYCQYNGEHKELIQRSALTLKMLIHSDSGAIVAAPTTSLPETIGGQRNWDYRYCWPRDSAFTLYALGYLGYSGEADAFAAFMKKAIVNHPMSPLKVIYNVDGESNIPEKIIPDLKGYMSGQPVRVGNQAHDQIQLDTYGEFLDWAYLHQVLGGEIDQVFLEKIEMTAELVVKEWKNKDSGIWEVRSSPEDFTYSKIMCWVALDRAEILLNQKDKYLAHKIEIESFIHERCIINRRLKRSAQNSDIDASLLLVWAVGFPLSKEIYENTVELIFKELSSGPYIKRYRSEDGLEGEEGYFLVCSFWAINACLFLGKDVMAKELFNKTILQFNDLGLMSEEFDPETHHFLGNFPQALTHLALIETASYFEIYAKLGAEGLKGCHSDRVRILHKTLHGPRAVWNFILNTGHIKKIFPSSASIFQPRS